MATIVQKYGGSSVADLDKIRGVAKRIVQRKHQGDRLVVVISAMGKTTDALISQARALTVEPPRRELDMLVTAGERISMALLSMAIWQEGVEAISFTGSQSGIITEDAHQGARIVEVRPYRILEELESGRVVIVAGYQGVSQKKEITTLGRGGSDTTAVALAAALHADACEIYSDVDGVYTADPRICPQAKLLPEVSYEIMQTMAGAGAKVLHSACVEFARRAGIAIVARKTADSSGRETKVHGVPLKGGVQAVVGAMHLSWLSLAGDLHEELLAALERVGARLVQVTVAECTRILVDRTDLPEKDSQLLERAVREFSMDIHHCGSVTLVGASLSNRREVWEAIADLAPGRLGLLSSELSVTVLVHKDDVEALTRNMHQRFCSG